MSRTDAHVPYWVWASWYEPSHHLYCPNRMGARHRWKIEPCNLPKQPVRHAGARSRLTQGLCTWEPVWPAYREVRWLVLPPTPRWFIRHVWSGPERARERDKLGRLAKEYNARRELDDADFPNWQARHGARWLWS